MIDQEIARTLLRNASRVLSYRDSHFLGQVAGGRNVCCTIDPSGKDYGDFADTLMSLLTQKYAAYLRK
jgi:hypothetical protein